MTGVSARRDLGRERSAILTHHVRSSGTGWTISAGLTLPFGNLTTMHAGSTNASLMKENRL
jgi:hypothetical protein